VSKELDKLIEQVLAEKINVQGLKDKILQKPDYQTPYSNKKTDIDDLAALDGDSTTIGQPDVTAAFSDNAKDKERAAALFLSKALKKNSDEKKEINQFLSTVTKAKTDAAEFTAGKVQAIDPKNIRSIAFKSLQTVSADPDANSEMGQYPEGIATALNTVFQGKNTFKSRLEELKKVCESAISNLGSVSKGTSPSSAIANMLVLDYVSTLVREVDAGAAAYNFEAFLAMLTGGRVIGKELTSAGKMGGADFRSFDKSAGSAKYYKNLSGITQSSKGFKIGEPVYYVIAIKRGQSGKGTSDPRQITSLNIYTFFLIKLEDNVNGRDYFAFKYSNGTTEIVDIKAGTKLNLSSGLNKKGDPLEIKLVTTKNQQDIRSVVEAIVRDQDNNVANALGYFKQLSENLHTANEKSQAYGSTGNVKKGDEALEAIQESETSFDNLKLCLDGKCPDKKKNPTTESKSPLNQLIEAVAKQNLLK